MRIAGRAGIRQASEAIASISSSTIASVTGSVGSTPIENLFEKAPGAHRQHRSGVPDPIRTTARRATIYSAFSVSTGSTAAARLAGR